MVPSLSVMGCSRTVETPFGSVEFSFDDSAQAPAADDIETESLVQTVNYCLETRDPEVTRAVLDIFSEQQRWQMPFGFDVHELSEEHVDAMLHELQQFVQHRANSGELRLRDLHTFVTATPTLLEELEYVPPAQERESFIGVVVVDQDDEPVEHSRIRVKLPDGDVKEGRTNSLGELMIKGFATDGAAEITLLDFADALPTDEKSEFDDHFQLIDEVSGEPLADYMYRLETESGIIVEGRTDSNGCTQKISSAKQEQVNISVVSDLVPVSTTAGASGEFDEQFQLIDEVSGEPLVDYPYRLETESGVVVQGRTDSDGYTRRISSRQQEYVFIRDLTD